MLEKKNKLTLEFQLDWILVGTLVSLVLLGLVVVTSASIVIAERRLGQPFYYTIHQAAFLLLGLILGAGVLTIPVKWWFKTSLYLLIGSIVLLGLVLIPGIGKVVNGSSRWIAIGGLSFQVSELVKLCVIVYLSRYIILHHNELRDKVLGFLKPLALLSIVSFLLILEPDFGATVVIMSTGMGMLFLSGVALWQFLALLGVVASALFFIAIAAPYRLERLTSFLDPWADQYDSGYQLTQALIAFGRGEWFGVGLGSSVQKLFYLPEAHTDFVFAVLAEELGLFGALGTIALYVILIWRGVLIGIQAQKRHDKFAAFISFGLILWIALQTLINIGVNTGLLPTKGLTLPFLSYGGSSLLILCIAMGLLLRINFENMSHQNSRIKFGYKIK